MNRVILDFRRTVFTLPEDAMSNTQQSSAHLREAG
jgi:hypothetical protein